MAYGLATKRKLASYNLLRKNEVCMLKQNSATLLVGFERNLVLLLKELKEREAYVLFLLEAWLVAVIIFIVMSIVLSFDF